MYYIDNYREEAINKLVPYLISFPDIVKLTENSADRYQAVEDVLWKIATNFRLVDSRGVFLDAHAHNEVVELIYTDKARDAFTYGTQYPLTQAFGTGHFYSQSSYKSAIPKDVSEEKLIRAVQEKIIQNNTKGVIEDFIEAMQLHFNASKVEVFESYPLAISLMLSGENLELSSSGNREAIKKCLPTCVSLKNFYINDHKFNQFTYSTKSNYAFDSRYPILLNDSLDIYNPISTAINLNSTDEEYIKINNPFYGVNFEEYTPFECIIGKITELNDGATIYSFTFDEDKIYKISLQIKQNNGEYKFVILKYEWDEENSTWINPVYENTTVIAEINKDYTILLNISRDISDYLRIWIFNGVKISGQNSNQDISWAYNIIQNNNNYVQLQLNKNYYNYNSLVNCDILGIYETFEIRSHITYDYSTGHWQSFIYKDNQYIALSDVGYISTSKDGITWSNPINILDNSYSLPNNGWKNITVLNDKLIVVNSDFSYIGISDDNGLSWYFEQNIKLQNIEDIISAIYNNVNTLIAIKNNGNILISTDGLNWDINSVNLGNHLWQRLIYNGTIFVALGDGYSAISLDGEEWNVSSFNSILSGFSWVGLIYKDNKFIALSSNGYITTSTDGIVWTDPVEKIDVEVYDLLYNNGATITLCTNNGVGYLSEGVTNVTSFGDFTYYAIMGGTINSQGNIDINSNSSHYYATCFGEKNILFNCLTNKNHVIINTISTLQNNLVVQQSSYNYKQTHSNGRYFNINNPSGEASIQWNKVEQSMPSDVLINSFELSMDLCLPIKNNNILLKGLLGPSNDFEISYSGTSRDILTIILPTFTSGNIEVPYTVTYTGNNLSFNNKFGNLKLNYNDNILSIYINNTLVKTENILNVNLKYLGTKLELGPINAFIKNLKFNCKYTDGIEENILKYDLPLNININETNRLIEPTNTNGRFLTVPQLIDNTQDKDLYGNPTLRQVNF